MLSDEEAAVGGEGGLNCWHSMRKRNITKTGQVPKNAIAQNHLCQPVSEMMQYKHDPTDHPKN